MDDAAAPGTAPVGAYVRLRLETTASSAAIAAACQTLATAPGAGVAQSLRHENRLTVLHFLVRRASLGGGDGESPPLPSKEEVEVSCGHRRWPAWEPTSLQA